MHARGNHDGRDTQRPVGVSGGCSAGTVAGKPAQIPGGKPGGRRCGTAGRSRTPRHRRRRPSAEACSSSPYPARRAGSTRPSTAPTKSSSSARRSSTTWFASIAKLNPQPELASDWKVSEDGKSWTFNLQRGVKFHHGREFTSKDVEFTINRLLNPATASMGRSLFGLVQKIETPGPYVVKFDLERSVCGLSDDVRRRLRAHPAVRCRGRRRQDAHRDRSVQDEGVRSGRPCHDGAQYRLLGEGCRGNPAAVRRRIPPGDDPRAGGANRGADQRVHPHPVGSAADQHRDAQGRPERQGARNPEPRLSRDHHLGRQAAVQRSTRDAGAEDQPRSRPADQRRTGRLRHALERQSDFVDQPVLGRHRDEEARPRERPRR